MAARRPRGPRAGARRSGLVDQLAADRRVEVVVGRAGRAPGRACPRSSTRAGRSAWPPRPAPSRCGPRRCPGRSAKYRSTYGSVSSLLAALPEAETDRLELVVGQVDLAGEALPRPGLGLGVGQRRRAPCVLDPRHRGGLLCERGGRARRGRRHRAWPAGPGSASAGRGRRRRRRAASPPTPASPAAAPRRRRRRPGSQRGEPPAAPRAWARRRSARRRCAAGRGPRRGRLQRQRRPAPPRPSSGRRRPRCPRPGRLRPRPGRARRPGRRRRCGGRCGRCSRSRRGAAGRRSRAAPPERVHGLASSRITRPGVVVGVEQHRPVGRRRNGVGVQPHRLDRPGTGRVRRSRWPGRAVRSRSAGWSAGGVRRITPAARSSSIRSGPAVRSQLSVNVDRSPAPARSQLSKQVVHRGVAEPVPLEVVD